MEKLKIENLHVATEENKKILKGINFTFETGKIYAVIGPNGHGKSTLLASIMGDPSYKITNGKILLNDLDLTEKEVDIRANHGIYLSMQYPAVIEGISNLSLLKSALDKKLKTPISQIQLYAQAQELAKALRIESEMVTRDVNVGFSGGEKKKNELLHMFMLKPTFAFLDEVDSGLDVDSISSVAHLIKKSAKKGKRAFIIVSHYLNLYQIIKPDYVLIIKNGQIKQVGNYDLLIDTLKKGFDYE